MNITKTKPKTLISYHEKNIGKIWAEMPRKRFKFISARFYAYKFKKRSKRNYNDFKAKPLNLNNYIMDIFIL